ncbi:MAG: SAM-dependent methyltransferase [Planctomycetota bacterium]
MSSSSSSVDPVTVQPSNHDDRRFVSRGGLKLDAALDAFASHGIEPTGLTCADLGCSTGGFTDALLQRGAEHVFAVDTAYGELAWTLRQDPRVTVLERSNALHIPPPEDAHHACGGVVIDLGWTKQAKALPAALPWLAPDGWVISLVKPHYESGHHRLDDGTAQAICDDVLQALPDAGWTVIDSLESPVRGGKGRNLEVLALLQPLPKP